MIQCQNPVEWVVDWLLGWLLTYSGSDCELWQLVFRKCMESRLCRRLIELLLDELAKHRCYDPALINDLDAEIIETQAPNHSHNNQSQPPQQHRTTTQKPCRNSNHLSPQKQSSLKRPCRLDAYALLSLKPLKPTSPLPHPPPNSVGAPPDRGLTEPGAAHRWGLGGWAWEDNSVGPSKGGPHRTA